MWVWGSDWEGILFHAKIGRAWSRIDGKMTYLIGVFVHCCGHALPGALNGDG